VTREEVSRDLDRWILFGWPRSEDGKWRGRTNRPTVFQHGGGHGQRWETSLTFLNPALETTIELRKSIERERSSRQTHQRWKHGRGWIGDDARLGMAATVILWTMATHSERTEMREERRRGLEASQSCCESRWLAYDDVEAAKTAVWARQRRIRACNHCGSTRSYSLHLGLSR
jgi:hypothetical protein